MRAESPHLHDFETLSKLETVSKPRRAVLSGRPVRAESPHLHDFETLSKLETVSKPRRAVLSGRSQCGLKARTYTILKRALN